MLEITSSDLDDKPILLTEMMEDNDHHTFPINETNSFVNAVFNGLFMMFARF